MNKIEKMLSRMSKKEKGHKLPKAGMKDGTSLWP